MELNTIILYPDTTGSFFGPIASPYSYRPELRQRLDDVFSAAQTSSNRFFVLEGSIVRAAQTSLDGAKSYMQDGRVLVYVVKSMNEEV